MVTQYRCKSERRLSRVRSQPGIDGQFLNGIAYLEVSIAPLTLLVSFVHSLPGELGGVPTTDPETDASNLSASNFRIDGGVRVKNIQVESVSAFANQLTLRVNKVGDLSAYQLRLVDPSNLNDPDMPPPGFDSQLASVRFFFGTQTVSEFDCHPTKTLLEPVSFPPLIDYLAKDYGSFRRLMLDRLSVTMPKWKERNPADIGVMLVELLAHEADHLSYYQDAVATEAYLGTARKRTSVRRHARLLDYYLHDGGNARTWVAISVDSEGDGTVLSGAVQASNIDSENTTEPACPTQFLTQVSSQNKTVLTTTEDFQQAIAAGAQVFEAMHDVVLYACRNEIRFHTWGDDHCELPAGSTAATLVDDANGSLAQHLCVGDVLILEALYQYQSQYQNGHDQQGQLIAADQAHRQAVRLTQVRSVRDQLLGTPLVQVEWDTEDALLFALSVSCVNVNGRAQPLSVARGNVVLVDHGRTLPDALGLRTRKTNNDAALLDETRYNVVPKNSTRYRPRLKRGILTQSGHIHQSASQSSKRTISQSNGPPIPFDPSRPAATATKWAIQDVRPSLQLIEHRPYSKQCFVWQAQTDLLGSDRFARDFVVETEDDGQAYLRFGDGILGQQPEPSSAFTVTYRIGTGTAGNIGADAIAHLYLGSSTATNSTAASSIQALRNPLPAKGGIDPEPIDRARQNAPEAFRQQRRAVTEKDYAALVETYPDVRKAIAHRRWTGSWQTLFITVDRAAGQLVDEAFETSLRQFLEPFRLSGHALKIESPRFVPLQIGLTIEVKPDQYRSAIKAALLEAFSSVQLADGRRGFFHPDNFTFGQPVYLSKVIEAAIAIEGVNHVKSVNPFQRWGGTPQGEIEAGQIQLGRLEIARLDNSADMPENGRLQFTLLGGL